MVDNCLQSFVFIAMQIFFVLYKKIISDQII